MAGKLCVYVRDSRQPSDLYDSSGHHFAVSIHEVGSGRPLCWKGVNYNWVWLPFKGEFDKVAGEYEVPAGAYLVKGYAWCENVVTHVAWVQVNDGETASVNLLPTTVLFCLWAATIGVAMGTAIVQGRPVAIAQLAPEEAKAFENAAMALVARLPKDIGIPLMAVEELHKRKAENQKD